MSGKFHMPKLTRDLSREHWFSCEFGPASDKAKLHYIGTGIDVLRANPNPQLIQQLIETGRAEVER